MIKLISYRDAVKKTMKKNAWLFFCTFLWWKLGIFQLLFIVFLIDVIFETQIISFEVIKNLILFYFQKNKVFKMAVGVHPFKGSAHNFTTLPSLLQG